MKRFEYYIVGFIMLFSIIYNIVAVANENKLIVLEDYILEYVIEDYSQTHYDRVIGYEIQEVSVNNHYALLSNQDGYGTKLYIVTVIDSDLIKTVYNLRVTYKVNMLFPNGKKITSQDDIVSIIKNVK